jgi:hypothetical protein
VAVNLARASREPASDGWISLRFGRKPKVCDPKTIIHWQAFSPGGRLHGEIFRQCLRSDTHASATRREPGPAGLSRRLEILGGFRSVTTRKKHAPKQPQAVTGSDFRGQLSHRFGRKHNVSEPKTGVQWLDFAPGKGKLTCDPQGGGRATAPGTVPAMPADRNTVTRTQPLN